MFVRHHSREFESQRLDTIFITYCSHVTILNGLKNHLNARGMEGPPTKMYIANSSFFLRNCIDLFLTYMSYRACVKEIPSGIWLVQGHCQDVVSGLTFEWFRKSLTSLALIRSLPISIDPSSNKLNIPFCAKEKHFVSRNNFYEIAKPFIGKTFF